jgi:hypothetical protein
MRRGQWSRLVEREQKVESHLVTMPWETLTLRRKEDEDGRATSEKTETEEVGVDCNGRFTEGRINAHPRRLTSKYAALS